MLLGVDRRGPAARLLIWVIFRAGDDTRLAMSGQLHRLSFVELRILKGRHAKQPISQSGLQAFLRYIDLIAESQLYPLGQFTDNRRLLAVSRGRNGPRFFIFVFRGGNRTPMIRPRCSASWTMDSA
jgi:hypothetical protein